MAMMPGLQINIGQQLKLTPQLQQSIKILQYSALEVQQTIATTLESNFMLEVAEEEPIEFTEHDPLEAEPPTSEQNDPADLDLQADTSNDAEAFSTDYAWEDIYADRQLAHESTGHASRDSDEFNAPETYTAAHTSLHHHLTWQADIYKWATESDAYIASYIIDEIDEDGYLRTPLCEMLLNLQRQIENTSLSILDLEDVLKVIQQFEPTGVGARDLPECLLLQLKAQKQTPFHVTAVQLIQRHFDWLTYHDFKRIKKSYGLHDDQLEPLLKLIQSLNPKPGRQFANTELDLIVPDLMLKRRAHGWLVELNSQAFPNLQVNQAYIDLSSSIKDQNTIKQIKEQLNEARNLIKSVHHRGETLLRVGHFIVERQKRFFDEGEQAMQPLVLREVAEALDLHESTISRATNQKYIQTPRGVFELKYFFSSGVSQFGNEDQSSVAIKAHLKELIAQEDPKKPISDNKLMALLSEKDINVARRTIAKYREAMGIPSSSERKKRVGLR
ncbi:RNA polymerase factor sigma-54 [Thiomicrospira sp. ALE5]|uniref:RNA polymerase factor sigma-54 n=1 Tax=Thiomicrospira sp. ALE5 TaxID=748650 RepID=UPI0008DF4132|nr:RNA polymerase factor sigma-54 [Thiomicrospira sp. ALE5]SFR49940.1 RNA polymerase, sigma 54 subunit, RpoN/SigL [Thiomicrospira sp. ALE5]